VVPAGALSVGSSPGILVLPGAPVPHWHGLGYSPRKTRLATAIADMAFGQPA